jgi:hypothetical protein
MVLRTIEALGPLHGYGIARRIDQTSGDFLSLNYGTLYPALLKLDLSTSTNRSVLALTQESPRVGGRHSQARSSLLVKVTRENFACEKKRRLLIGTPQPRAHRSKFRTSIFLRAGEESPTLLLFLATVFCDLRLLRVSLACQ